VTWKYFLQALRLHCMQAPVLALEGASTSQRQQDWAKRDSGMRSVLTGSIECTSPNSTSGMYSAQTTCAQPPRVVRLSAPLASGQSMHCASEADAAQRAQYHAPSGTETMP